MALNETSLAQHLDHHDHHRDESEDQDALSFCDLMMDENDENDLPTSDNYDDDEEEDHLFEFLTSPDDTENARTDKIVFCGKTIMPRKHPSDDVIRYPRKDLLVRRDSFKKCHSSGGARRSSSFRFGGFGGPKAATVVPADIGGYYRSSSGGSRKQKVFIGLVMKLEPTMELSEIRKRQGLRGPAPMFPATGSAGGREERSSGSCRHQRHHYWGSLWCRAHLVSALTKASFGCISH